jgi:hypothetical protein
LTGCDDVTLDSRNEHRLAHVRRRIDRPYDEMRRQLLKLLDGDAGLVREPREGVPRLLFEARGRPRRRVTTSIEQRLKSLDRLCRTRAGEHKSVFGAQPAANGCSELLQCGAKRLGRPGAKSDAGLRLYVDMRAVGQHDDEVVDRVVAFRL